MAASAGVAGYGATFKKSTVTIGEVISISGPGLKKGIVEVTHLASADNHKEFISGMIDGGEVSCSLNLEATGMATLLTDVTAAAFATYTVDWGAYSWAFSATCVEVTPEVGGAEEPIRCSAKFKLTGKVTAGT